MNVKISLTLLIFLLINLSVVQAQSDAKKSQIVSDSKDAKAEFLKADKGMNGFFSKAYGYVIFPNVGKGGLGIGGASGNGAVYQGGKLVGSAKLTQVSIGLQAGGQAYREVIFFESD